MTEKFDGVIFDVDGTLWDSTDRVAFTYNRIFEREGVSARVTGSILKKLFGKPMDVIFAQLLPEVEEKRRMELADVVMDAENQDLETYGADYYPDVVETFRLLSEKVPLFIVSNCQKGYIEIVLEGADLGKYVKDYLCFGDTGTSKGQTILTLMKKNGLKNPVYVGDVQGDADACKEAGIPIIYCAYGFGTIEEPYAVIHGLKELTGII